MLCHPELWANSLTTKLKVLLCTAMICKLHEKTHSAYSHFSALYKINWQAANLIFFFIRSEVDFSGVWLPTPIFVMCYNKSVFSNKQDSNIVDTFKKTRFIHCLAYNRCILNLWAHLCKELVIAKGTLSAFIWKTLIWMKCIKFSD